MAAPVRQWERVPLWKLIVVGAVVLFMAAMTLQVLDRAQSLSGQVGALVLAWPAFYVLLAIFYRLAERRFPTGLPASRQDMLEGMPGLLHPRWPWHDRMAYIVAPGLMGGWGVAFAVAGAMDGRVEFVVMGGLVAIFLVKAAGALVRDLRTTQGIWITATRLVDDTIPGRVEVAWSDAFEVSGGTASVALLGHREAVRRRTTPLHRLRFRRPGFCLVDLRHVRASPQELTFDIRRAAPHLRESWLTDPT